MNEKNTKYLLEKYPKLYAQFYLPPQQTCMCWGFAFSDGWFKLINNLSRRITKLDTTGTVQAEQVKEKFGGLRFYYGGRVMTKEVAEQIRHLVDEAEEKSFHLCEECGKKGEIRNDIGWYRTLCIRHYKQAKGVAKKKILSLKPFKHKTNKKYKVKQ